MSKMEINDKIFKEKVLKSEKPVMVMFWGSWCPACKASQRMLKIIKNEVDVNIFTMNIDKNPISQSKYEIASTPTFILFRNGKLIGMEFGSKSTNQLKKFLEMDT